MSGRVSAVELSSLPPGSSATVAGRVIARTHEEALLADASGVARLGGRELPALYSLAMVEGVWDGRMLSAARVLHVQAAVLGDQRDSEHAALLKDGRAKLRRLYERARILEHVRGFFRERGFVEVETPLAVPSPGLDLHLSAVRVEASRDERYLITSPEYQMKRLLAGGLERVVQIGKCFRQGEVGARHQPEFTMLEWYRAWASVEDVMHDTEELVASIASPSGSAKRLLRTAGGDVDVTPPWPRLTVREAFERFAGVDALELERDESAFYRVLIDHVEPALSTLGAVFLCEYPASMASLARQKPGNPRVAERFEAYVAGVELCNGFGELTDPIEQRARLERDQAARAAQGLPVYPIDERFMAALEEGIPPSGGNALGLDRLIMLALGAEHIEDVIAIPASRL